MAEVPDTRERRMQRSNLLNWLLVAGMFLLVILGCKSAEEKARQRQNQAQREQQAQQKQKTAETIKTMETKADEWSRLAPPVKLVKDPYIKGKLVVVYRRAND